MAYISDHYLFRDLDDNEELQFREYARMNDPRLIDPDLKNWELYHPVCRDEWEKRGIKPE